MASPRGKRPTNQMENLSPFGQVYYRICEIVQIDASSLAEEAGISRSFASRITRGERRMSRDTTDKLWACITTHAEKKHVIFPQGTREHFYQVAGFTLVPEQQKARDWLLKALKAFPGERKKTADP